MTDVHSSPAGDSPEPHRSPGFGDRLKALSTQVSEAMGFDWMYFHLTYGDWVDLYAPESLVADYITHHQTWFSRCALPMQATPVGDRGYDLLIGRYGAFKFEVEVRIGLELIPRDASGVYRICSMVLPDYTPPGYQVNFQGLFSLQEMPCSLSPELVQELPDLFPLSEVMTRWQWTLDLTVAVQFPQFIRRLPQSLIQKTSDRLLSQIVREISRRLGKKVQQDFHQTLRSQKISE